ncbi:hypothetical protein [Ensifer sp. BR816]|uniref:hypothetical protein n=1 Tax=Rhizobium sp. (strain BR816) TaxID=1057002 RepID=UPI0012FAA902|nr:hypothetical protein [Ensifer sp. BR816]
MAVAYSVGPITRRQVDKTHRLIEAVGYPVDLQAWREVCALAFARKWPAIYSEEVITAENPLGYIAGVCIMRPAHDSMHGRVLEVPVFVVATAADTRGASNSLLDYLMESARNRRCRFIRVAPLEPASWPGLRRMPHQNGRGLLIPV